MAQNWPNLRSQTQFQLEEIPNGPKPEHALSVGVIIINSAWFLLDFMDVKDGKSNASHCGIIGPLGEV